MVVVYGLEDLVGVVVQIIGKCIYGIVVEVCTEFGRFLVDLGWMVLVLDNYEVFVEFCI